MITRLATSNARSPLSRCAHVVERIGLATAGASCALFVAAFAGRSSINLLGSAAVVLVIVLYGAAGFYLGIDLPQPPAHRLRQPLLRGRGSKTDAVELLSAAGTFLASTMAFASVYVIILDETVGATITLFIGSCWAIGATMQIAAGGIARARSTGASEP
jgi:hypothetical protein